MKKYFIIFIFSLLLTASPKAWAADNFSLVYGDKKIPVDQETLDSWKGAQAVSPSNVFPGASKTFQQQLQNYVGNKTTAPASVNNYSFRLKPIYAFINNFAQTVNTTSADTILKIENNRAVEFTPPQNGLAVDSYKSALDALRNLSAGRSESEITVEESLPKNTLAQTNALGINELIAEGVSSFKGSPKNRRHNIEVGVEKFKGLIIQKGEEFSFNKYLGPVDAESGFLPELVIKKEGTVPEFGGGLCQVSSTTFRAAMIAGLPITQRRNHAYAVQYYAPQGTDATIYPGVVDLKFVNNTPGSILVWPYFKDKDTLIFDFYGTKDDRQVTLEKPIQYDRKPDGSLKASWTRIITKDGETSSSTFKSIYQSPALYHKEEQFVSTTSTPAQTAPNFTPATITN
ncbi:MAG: VanW family protein [Candidatus Doudnabacteria bacterium]|nr:VanW family protein [Candidatus Doudnabacteria bacterium]